MLIYWYLWTTLFIYYQLHMNSTFYNILGNHTYLLIFDIKSPWFQMPSFIERLSHTVLSYLKKNTPELCHNKPPHGYQCQWQEWCSKNSPMRLNGRSSERWRQGVGITSEKGFGWHHDLAKHNGLFHWKLNVYLSRSKLEPIKSKTFLMSLMEASLMSAISVES